jgi:hypothetical protein
MKCPLAIVDKYNDFDRGTQAVFPDCLEEECAWWCQDTEHEGCAIRLLVRYLKQLRVSIAR